MSNFKMSWHVLIQATLILAITLSALGIVYSKHLTRSYYSELQVVQLERDQLFSERTRLLLEQSAWTADSRIEEIAREQLNMIFPESRIFIRVEQ